MYGHFGAQAYSLWLHGGNLSQICLLPFSTRVVLQAPLAMTVGEISTGPAAAGNCA